MYQKQESLRIRIKKDKELILEQLKKTPIVSIAREKTGTSRATYYRWKKEDEKFLGFADVAIAEGSQLINDMAESQLLSAIKDKNLTAIIFWLKHHHPAYETRIELRQAASRFDSELTDKDRQIVKAALELIRQDSKYKLEGDIQNEDINHSGEMVP